MALRRLVVSLLSLALASLLTVGASAPASAEEERNPYDRWVLEPANAVIKPGESVTYTLTFLDEHGQPTTPPDLPVRLSTDGYLDVKKGLTVTAVTPGSRSVAALSEPWWGTTSLRVIGDPVTLAIAADTTTVEEGGTVGFDVTGVDRWGTAIDGEDATLTSSIDSDTVDGLRVTFASASTHVITATLGGLTAAVSVEVAAKPAEGADGPGAGPTNAGEPAAQVAPKPAGELAQTGAEPAAAGSAAAALVFAGATMAIVMRGRGVRRRPGAAR